MGAGTYSTSPPAVAEIVPRGICSVCRREVSVLSDDTAGRHGNTEKQSFCPGWGRKVARILRGLER